MKVAIANFKAELSLKELQPWLQDFKNLYQSEPLNQSVQIILCPPTIYLSQFKQALLNTEIKLGSQDISRFSSGAYTGEVTGAMLVDWVDYVLIGHSERRIYCQESTKQIQEKITLANKSRLNIILCLEQPETYEGEFFAMAYEPRLAIGSGTAANSQQSWQAVEKISSNIKAQVKLYGGSVDEDNVSEFTRAGFNGVLVGKKSLSPVSFWKIVQNL